MSKVVNTQTREPGKRFQAEPGFHYLIAEMDHGEYTSAIDQYKAGFSEASGHRLPRYEVVSEEREVTGHKRKVMLRCPEEDYQAYLMERDAEARGSLKAQGQTPGTEDEFRTAQRGEISHMMALKSD